MDRLCSLPSRFWMIQINICPWSHTCWVTWFNWSSNMQVSQILHFHAILTIHLTLHLMNIWRFLHCGVWISRFVLDVSDSVQFHHDITFCLDSDSIIVSFSSGTSFLRLEIILFWFQHITWYFLSSCFVVFIDILRTRNDEYALSPGTSWMEPEVTLIVVILARYY